jgi:ABC-type Fe3+-siderophore transport system permease subunit
MFKSLVLAIFATIFLTFVLGSSLIDLLDVDVYMGNQLIEPLKAISISAIVVVLLVVAALAIVLSVFGTIIFVGLLIFGGIALALIGVFWPVLLIAGLIWLVVRDKPSPQYN